MVPHAPLANGLHMPCAQLKVHEDPSIVSNTYGSNWGTIPGEMVLNAREGKESFSVEMVSRYKGTYNAFFIGVATEDYDTWDDTMACGDFFLSL